MDWLGDTDSCLICGLLVEDIRRLDNAVSFREAALLGEASRPRPGTELFGGEDLFASWLLACDGLLVFSE